MADNVDQLDVRVILVGSTGLDAALRLDSGIELVRVRTPLEAIGELSSPIDDHSPDRAVVVVAPDVEKTLGDHEASGTENGDGPRHPQTNGAARVGDFVRGLRLVDPSVVVLGMGRAGGKPPSSYDATIAPDLPAETLRRVIRSPLTIPAEAKKASPPVPAASPAPARPINAPRSESVEAMLSTIHATDQHNTDHHEACDVDHREQPLNIPQPQPGDLQLVTKLLKGQDILPTAMSIIRDRTGHPEVEFVPATDSTLPSAPHIPPADGDEPVAWEETTFGHLRGPAVQPGTLAMHARWLAGWLRARDQQTQLKTAAFTDPLTGAWNRRYFDRFLSMVIGQSKDVRRHVTILLFDIDDFKTYNDRYGHDAGDDILRETVRLIRSVIRPTDRVCRIGGDEFAVIFHEPQGPRQEGSRHPGSVFEIAHRFQQQILRHRFPKLGGCAPGTLTISGGLATFPWDGATPEELLTKADQLALASKRQGKNAITFGPGVIRLHEDDGGG